MPELEYLLAYTTAAAHDRNVTQEAFLDLTIITHRCIHLIATMTIENTLRGRAPEIKLKPLMAAAEKAKTELAVHRKWLTEQLVLLAECRGPNDKVS